MEKLFKLKENKTDIKTEVLAGITTFMTMAYIITLNPTILTAGEKGTPLWNAVFLATCIASGLGTFLMAFLANLPFAMAPGMGLNTFFATIVANVMVMTGGTYVSAFQAALCIILVEGIVFVLLSILRVREKILDAIPMPVRLGIAPAIGLMLISIGFGSNAGVYAEGNSYAAPFYVIRDFFGVLSPSALKNQMGDAGYGVMVLSVVTMFVGLFAIILLDRKKIKGAVLFGLLIASGVYWAGEALFLGTNPFAMMSTGSWLPPVQDMANLTLFKFDFATLGKLGFFTVFTLILTLTLVDMFDTIGALDGTARRANMLGKDGKLPRMKQAFLADAGGTIVGAMTGTSTVTTFVESSAGVEVGGRTGLTSFITGILFLACMFISPVILIIPSAATSSALIYVGILMFQGLKKIDFMDIEQVVPVVVMIITMAVADSIGHGIGLGMICYTVIKLFTGKIKDVSVLTIVLSIVFVIKFFLIV